MRVLEGPSPLKMMTSNVVYVVRSKMTNNIFSAAKYSMLNWMVKKL
jgi:hypothetical protein